MFSGIVIYYFFKQSFLKKNPLHNQTIAKQTSGAFLICRISYPVTARGAFPLYLLSHHSKGYLLALSPSMGNPRKMQAERSQSFCALRGKGCTGFMASARFWFSVDLGK